MNEAGLAILRPYPCSIVGDWHFKVVYNSFSLEILIPSSPKQKKKKLKTTKKLKTHMSKYRQPYIHTYSYIF